MPQGLWLGKLDRGGTTHGTGNRGWESFGEEDEFGFIHGKFKVSVGNKLGMCRGSWYLGLD